MVAVAFWCAALALSIGTYSLTNDQFGRISPARQIAAYGALPFRDYLDPGYYLTEISSAILQRLLGDNLLGELLLNTVFIATGSLLVLLQVRRLTGSTLTGIAAATVAWLSLPRAYDYDKVLFYPLGLFVLWRYLAAPRLGRLSALAATIVVAGLFRYDNGVYIAVVSLVGILVVHGFSRPAARDATRLIVATAVVAAPFLVFIQFNGGLANAIDQMVTYGARERARTRLTSLPPLVMGRWLTVDAPTVGTRIIIRWPAGLDAAGRAQAASRLGLSEEAVGNLEARTWSYGIVDESVEHIRQIVNDPAVEDTALIDRSRMQLEHPTTAWTRLSQRVPLLRLHVLPDIWSNAAAVLFYLLVALPIVALVALVAARAAMTTTETAGVASVIALTVLLDLLILREAIGARVGGMAGPPAVLGAWLVWWGFRRRWIRTTLVATVIVTATALTALAAAADWSNHLAPVVTEPSRIRDVVRVLSITPPTLDAVPAHRDDAMIAYVKRCTQPSDRVYASWFFPELYWFAQRPFAGGLPYTFGHHWSETRFQDRIVRAFQSQSVPLVLIESSNYGEFREVYGIVDAYLTSAYDLGGESSFGQANMPPDSYRVLVKKDRTPTRIDAEWGLPCFA